MQLTGLPTQQGIRPGLCSVLVGSNIARKWPVSQRGSSRRGNVSEMRARLPLRVAEKTQLQALRPPPPGGVNRQFQISIVPSRLKIHGSCDFKTLSTQPLGTVDSLCCSHLQVWRIA